MPNAILPNKVERVFRGGRIGLYYKDGSGVQFSEFDFVTASCQEIKIAFVVKIDIPLISQLLEFCSFYCRQYIKAINQLANTILAIVQLSVKVLAIRSDVS